MAEDDARPPGRSTDGSSPALWTARLLTTILSFMSRRDEAYDAMTERHLREWKADTRARRRFWIWTTIAVWLWAAPGFAMAAWAFRVTDEELGWILLRAGTVTVIVAVLAVVGRAVHVAQDRGWL